MKRAPEFIAKPCDPSTGSTLMAHNILELFSKCITVPSNYCEVHLLKLYTTQGYRVIALAAETMNPQITWGMSHEVEFKLELTGLLVMRNQSKGRRFVGSAS